MKQFLNSLFQRNGELTLFPIQTGSGKSYTIANVLAENFETKGFPQAFIVSPLKKLMGGIVDDINKFAKECNHENSVLVVKANEESWMSFFQNHQKVDLLRKALANEQDRDVISAIQARYRVLSALNVGDNTIFYELLQKDTELSALKKRLRPCLRSGIFAKFQRDNNLQEYADKCEACIKSFPFIAELFPELTFHRYKIVCLTASKLHRTSYNMMTGEVNPFWEYIPKESIIIFDESDQCKVWGKKVFEEEVLTRQSGEDEDKWALYHRLVNGIEGLIQRYSSPDDAIHIPFVERMYEALKKETDKSQSNLKLQPNLSGQKLDNFKDGLGVIYHDMDAISANVGRKLKIEHNDDIGQDYLIAVPDNNDKGDKRHAVSYVDYGITIYFKNVMRILRGYVSIYEDNERKRLLERKDNVIVMQTREQILREFLDAIGIHSEFDVRILKSYEGRANYDPTRTKGSFYNRSIYKDGITITEVLQKNGSMRSCKLRTTYLSNYPEHVLCDLVQKKRCQVILSSATADIKDPLHNYDFEFLEKELGAIHSIDDNTRTRLKKYIGDIVPDCEVYSEIMENDRPQHDIQQNLQELLSNPRVLQIVQNFLASNSYMGSALINLLLFFKDFCANPDAHAGLAVTPYAWNTKIGYGDSEYGMQSLQLILNEINDKYCTEKRVITKCLAGNTFEKDLQEVCKELKKENNGKALCLICYNSGSVGVNYEYEVTSDIREFAQAAVQRSSEKKCNFDSIYIEHPTNYITVGEDANSCLSACFDVSLLAERSYISSGKKNEYIIKLLRRRAHATFTSSNGKTYDNTLQLRSEIYETRPYREYCIQQVSQALGRLTRTSISRKRLNIYVDKKIATIIGLSPLPQAVTEAYRKLQLNIQEQLCITDNEIRNVAQKTDLDILTNSYYTWSTQCGKRIDSLVYKCNQRYYGDSQPELMENRDRLALWNDIFMKNPVVDDLSLIPETLRYFYRDSATTQTPMEVVSPLVHAKLASFMSNVVIKQYFEKRNYCSSPQGGKYWLAESAAKQLYQARVAEYAFKAIMEQQGIVVSELPKEIYERADWKVGDNLYVDVKFWRVSDFEQHTEITDWLRKVQMCSDGQYVIVNIPIEDDEEYEKEIIYPLGEGLSVVVINGLINLDSGMPDEENLTKLIKMSKGE